MLLIRLYCLLVFLLILNQEIYSQQWSAEVGIQSNYSTDNKIPFWFRSNQFGAIPMGDLSGTISAKINRNFQPQSEKISWKPEWSFSADTRINFNKRVQLQIIELNVGARIGVFDIVAGREKSLYGLVDSTLSLGSFSFSGNSLGIPKLEIRIPNYIFIPYTNKLLSFKGSVSHGWMGNQPIHYGQNRGDAFATKYHHLTFYGLIGKPSWKFKLETAINHDVIWGSDKEIFGSQYNLNDFQAFWYVLTGKAYKGPRDENGKNDISKIGNHLGSLDFAATYSFNNFNIRAYRQFFYDKGALRYSANIRDGLTGLVFKNLLPKERKYYIQKLLFEYFYSKDQGGQFGAPWTPSGPEYYYNHGVYGNGFSYKGQSLGTPIIIPSKDVKNGQANDPKDYFISNRVSAFHLGIHSLYNNWSIVTKFSIAKHFGDYHTSGPSEQWFNNKKIPQLFEYGKFTPVDQFSFTIMGSRPIFKTYVVSLGYASDWGQLLNKNHGIFIGFNKRFL
ncbi:capsule assembly Wzi family protein [Sphingobacterium sp. HJSM2_6]|uniref:capsule assembly Wzi family protein n=1 Tax=Sphingobacterium sp. HJSM2_6 TaxID=3366264 RepID=UPI003BCC8526